MALTLVEAAKYSNDILQVGVIEKLVYQDPIFEKLQFKDIKGNGLTYNIEATLSGAGWYAVGDTWEETTSTIGQATAVTTILGGDADVDNFLQATRSDVQDLMTEQITAKIKAIKKKFMDMFYYGYTTVDTKGFNGIQALIISSTSPYANTVAVATTSGTALLLSMERLEKAVDLVKSGESDLIAMSKAMRRSINKYLHGVGGITYVDAANGRIQTLFGLPVIVSDYISDDEDATTQYGTDESAAAVYGHSYTDGTPMATASDLATSIFVLQFAPDAVCGIQSLPITTEKLGSLETKDAERVRIKWYPGLMLQNIVTSAKVTGILVAGAVAA